MNKEIAKRLLCLLMILLLAGCGAADTTLAWQGTLAQSGSAIEARGKPVQEGKTDFYLSGDTQPERTLLLSGEACPVITLHGVERSAVQVEFAEPFQGGYHTYADADPVEKMDYRVATAENAVTFDLDTVYNFVFTVTTPQGIDRFLVVCGGKQG
jgi:hypothetical protein